MRETEEIREKIIKEVEKIKNPDILNYIHIIVLDIIKEDK